MDDPAYKRLFSRPAMVRDLLRGFAARDWSGALDFDTLTPLPPDYVSADLRRRQGDLVWRVRFRDDRWLYLVLLLEFQAAVDRAMAVRLQAYTALLYERLIAAGELRKHGALPPVLPIVIYNGRRPWTAAADVAELVASGGPALAPYQPSQRYFLFDEGRARREGLPRDNLVSTLIGLETDPDRARLPELLEALIGLLREHEDAALRQAFEAWIAQVLLPRRFRGVAPESLPRLEEVRTMLEENVREWTAEWVAEGREQGLEQGRAEGRQEGRAEGRQEGRAEGHAEERTLLCRMAARKFDAATAQELAAALAEVTDADRLAAVGDWIIECGTAADLLARLPDVRGPAD